MASSSIVITRGAERDLMTMPFPFRRQINEHVQKLKVQPEPASSRAVAGEVRVLAVSGWRVLYEVDTANDTVTIFGILPPV